MGSVVGPSGLNYGSAAALPLSTNFLKYTNVSLNGFSACGIVVVSREDTTAMPRKSPYRIRLSRAEARELRRRAAKYTLPYFMVVRAKMILLAAEHRPNDEIARALHTRREVVSLWRKRFFEQRLAGLEERPRPGRPRAFPPRGGGAGQGPGV